MPNLDERLEPRITLISAIGAQTRALGKNNGLLWRLPEDMRRFKELTTGHLVLMGRKTWESLPLKFRPLPERTNIVITRDSSYQAPGAIVATSIQEALAAAASASGSGDIFVIGGGELYALALPYADRLYLTLVQSDTPGDTFFPSYEDEFACIERGVPAGDPACSFTIWERK